MRLFNFDFPHKHTPFDVWQHVVNVEDRGEAPIMEIREWLDDTGKQTSVDVTDLGKVWRRSLVVDTAVRFRAVSGRQNSITMNKYAAYRSAMCTCAL